VFIRNRITAGGAVALVAVALGGASWALADNGASTQTISGEMTYYNDSGYGACGSTVNAATQDLVAVSHEWWTSADPNQDRLCKGVSVQVTYNGKTITVPVKDMCPSCDAGHIDLSQTAFQKLAPLEKGLVTGITWKFITQDGEEITPRPSSSPDPGDPEMPPTGVPGGSRPGSGFPAQYAAPYIETWGSPSELERARQAGLRYFTLAFVLDGGGCRATLNGNTPVTDQGWQSAVKSLRSAGGDVIASFGGASGTELGQGCHSVSALQEQYRSVVDALDLTRLDFDIEGSALADTAANHRRNQALAALQKQYEAAGRHLDVQFTLPSGRKGLEQDGVALLRDAESTGLRVTLVNIMTMDYGSPVQDMGQAAIDAATGLHDQLGQIWTSKSPQELWAMEGNTPMIGVNDTQGEVFTTEDAKRLESFAAEKGIQQLAFWAVGRDKACPSPGSLSDSCSGTQQSDYQFSRTFNAITAKAPAATSAPAPSGLPLPVDGGPSATPDDAGGHGGGGNLAKTDGPGRTIDSAFTTGYTWFDNTPRGSSTISAPVLHHQAGGTGTYADPITLAVGHSLAGGKDTLDYPAGTRFYVPKVRRYFIVEDACGDGQSPQNGPCHNLSTAPRGATTWIDMYVGGGSGDSESAVQACTDKVTGLTTVVENPGPNLPVVEGPLFQNGKCTDLYGATPTTDN
jgi:chitinase